MSFGIDAGISRNTNNSVQTAAKEDEVGTVSEITSFGGMEEKTEEIFTDSFTNEAVNGQTGNSGSGLVSQHNYIESNKEYARAQKTTMTPLAAPA